jgi:hypothetical protein
MKRRDFITLLGGAAAWPLAAWAQQADRVRRIGVLFSGDENDPLMKTGFSAFTQALADLGWTDGRNMRMDLRWGGGDPNRIRVLAKELVGLRPDIIVTGSTTATVAVERETRTIPIVFAAASDPVAAASFQAAAANADWNSVPGFGVILSNQPGAESWPMTAATFILIPKQPPDPAAAAEGLKFFAWAYAKGGKMAEELDYVPMPASVVNMVQTLWAKEIKDPSGKPLFMVSH